MTYKSACPCRLCKLCMKHPLRQKSRNMVLEAIAVLGEPKPHEILKWINNKNIKSLVDKLLATHQYVTISTTDHYLPEHMQKRKATRKQEPENERIKIRTVQYVCKELVQDGLVKRRDGGRYSLTDKVKEDIRFVAGLWNLQASSIVFRTDNIKDVANRLGTMILYTLIQSTKPFTTAKSAEHKNELALQWLNDSISVEGLLMSFIATFVPTPVKGLRNMPRFELPQEKYTELSDVLRKVNPQLLKEFENVRPIK